MNILGIIILIIIILIILSTIDRWFFLKIVIKDISRIDEDRKLLKTKTIMFFGLVRTNTDFIEYRGKYYMKFSDEEVSTNEADPKLIKKGLLKYNLEKK